MKLLPDMTALLNMDLSILIQASLSLKTVLRAKRGMEGIAVATRLCYFARSYSTLPSNMPGVVSLSVALIWVKVAVAKVPVDCRTPSFNTHDTVVLEGLPEKPRVVFVTKKLSPFRT